MAGTLSASITPASVSVSASVAFTASGALDVQSTVPVFAASAALSGTGTLSATATPLFASAANFSGTGALSATISQTYAPAPAFGTTGTLSVTLVASPAHYTDDFNRANSSSTAGADWTNQYNAMGINTNAAYPVFSKADGIASYNYAMHTDDHSVSVVAGTLSAGSNQDIYIFLGANTAGECAVLYCGVNTTRIYTSTVWSTFAAPWTSRASVSATYTTGDTMKLSRTGNVYTATKNGAAIGSGLTWTDSGNIVPRDSSHRIVGIGAYNNGSSGYRRIDSFAADDL